VAAGTSGGLVLLGPHCRNRLDLAGLGGTALFAVAMPLYFGRGCFVLEEIFLIAAPSLVAALFLHWMMLRGQIPVPPRLRKLQARLQWYRAVSGIPETHLQHVCCSLALAWRKVSS
jgi:hypothetical protein